jgi:hypothetical protein
MKLSTALIFAAATFGAVQAADTVVDTHVDAPYVEPTTTVYAAPTVYVEAVYYPEEESYYKRQTKKFEDWYKGLQHKYKNRPRYGKKIYEKVKNWWKPKYVAEPYYEPEPVYEPAYVPTTTVVYEPEPTYYEAEPRYY